MDFTKNIYILILLILIFSISKLDAYSIKGLWENDTKWSHYWQNSNFRFIEIETNKTIRFLDCDGIELEKYTYEVDKEKNIILSNGELYGKIEKITAKSFELRQIFVPKFQEGLTITHEFLVSFTRPKKTEVSTKIRAPKEYINKYEWFGEISKDSVHTELILNSIRSNHLLELGIVIKGKGEIIRKNQEKVRIDFYKGVYSINFLSDSKSISWMEISRIEENSIFLVSIEVKEKILLERMK